MKYQISVLQRWRDPTKLFQILLEGLAKTFQEMFDKGHMPNDITDGLIFLIPKADGPSDDIKKMVADHHP